MDSSRELEAQCELGGQHRCELEENLEILRRVPMFSGVSLERLMLYAYLGKRLCFPEGEFIFRQGEPVERCHIVVSGKVQVFREYPDHLVKVHELQEYDVLGGLAFLSEVKHLFSSKAVSPVEVLSLDRESLCRIIQQFPELTIRIADTIFRRLMSMVDKLLESQAHECIYRAPE
jgi:CRP-like cAMP-binding protein